MRQVLRKKIGFEGLIVSDDLEMGGVLSAAPIGEAAIQTLQAGSDLMLVCHKEEHVWLAFESVCKQAEADRNFAKLIATKSQRVLEFKRKSRALLSKTTPRPTPRTVDKLCRRIWEFTEEVRLTTEASR
jgi:beta-N-acetylhexosaminidase